MSIIQEALKKIPREDERTGVVKESAGKETRTEKIASPEKPLLTPIITQGVSRRPRRAAPVIVGFFAYCILAAFSFFGAQYFLRGPFHKDLESPILSDGPALYAPNAIINIEPKNQNPLAEGAASVKTAMGTSKIRPNFTLEGIMYISGRPRAIINNSVVEEGEKVNGATVTKITRESVVLDLNGSETMLSLR